VNKISGGSGFGVLLHLPVATLVLRDLDRRRARTSVPDAWAPRAGDAVPAPRRRSPATSTDPVSALAWNSADLIEQGSW